MRFVAVGAALLACVCTTWLVVLRRRASDRLQRRLAELGELLSDHPTTAPADVDTALARLARAVEANRKETSESAALASCLAQTLEAMPLGVVVADGVGGVVFQNRAALTLMGTGLDEALTSQAVADLLQSARAGQPTSRTLELYGPPPRTLAVSSVPIADGGTAAVIVEDVSEHRRLDAVRRDFVANVSHELKTPVSALGLLAETLAGEEDVDVVRRLAERMQKESFRVAHVIEDLLSLSRLEAEEAPRHEPVPVQAVVAEALEQVGPASALGQVSVHVGDVTPHWKVRGDRLQLVSALFNLLDNAVKYSDRGSTVEVTARSDGETVDLTVEDHGVGIPPRDLDRIFERFYRVDRGRARDTGGTGLGLSIVRHVAQNHAGEVLVESQEGEGSTFTLRLPAEPGPMGSSPRPDRA